MSFKRISIGFIDNIKRGLIAFNGTKKRSSNNYPVFLSPFGLKTTVTEEDSIGVAAVYAAVNTISSSIASMPLRIYQNAGKNKALATEHDQYFKIKSRPSPLYSSHVWRKTMITYMLLWGNGVSYIKRKGGRPAEYILVHPSDVEIFVEGGNKYYKLGAEIKKTVKHTEVIDFMGLSLDGIVGISVISALKTILATTINGNKLTESLYKNGTYSRQYISLQGKLKDDEAVERLRTSWATKYAGLGNAGKTPVLEEGGEVKYMGMPLVDLQLIDTMKFTVEEIARVFNLPPHKIGHLENASFSNITEQNMEYVTDTLMPIAVMVESELDYKIFTEADKGIYYTKIEFKSLLRPAHDQRAKFYKDLFYMGAITPNEIREFEDMNPVDGGDVSFLQVNLIPLSKADDYADALIEKGDKTDVKKTVSKEIIKEIKLNGFSNG